MPRKVSSQLRVVALGGTTAVLLLGLSLALLWLGDERFGTEGIQVDATRSAEEYEDLEKKFYSEYVIWTIKQNQRTFDWNLISTKIVFWVSMIVSFSGVAFAFWQFADAEKLERSQSVADELEIKTEMASLAFKTRSVAALILFVSIAYLLIYSIFIYPISFVPQAVLTAGERGEGKATRESADGAPASSRIEEDVDEERP